MTTEVVLTSWLGAAAAVRASVRSVADVAPAWTVTVLDADGSYSALGDELVRSPGDVGVAEATLHRLAAAGGPGRLCRYLEPLVLSSTGAADPVLLLRPGVLLLEAPGALLDGARVTGLGVISRVVGAPDDGLWPSGEDVDAAGRLAPALVAVRPGHPSLETWSGAGPDRGDGWWAGRALATPHALVEDPAALVSAWNVRPGQEFTDDDGLRLDGRPVIALDLSELDPHRPWVLRPSDGAPARARLSDHPALARRVAGVAQKWAADTRIPVAVRWDMTRTSLGHPADAVLQAAYGAPDADEAPDPFDPGSADSLRSWLRSPVGRRGPTRYVAAVRASRPDLVSAFPDVPGRDTGRLVAWAARHGAREGYAVDLLPSAGRRSRRPGRGASRPQRRTVAAPRSPGVCVIGYLTGELGIGESARLMVSALEAAEVPHASVPVDVGLLSRRSAPTPTETDVAGLGTALLCVNADLTPAVTRAVPRLLAQRRRIGMWYWEVEEFPASQHEGFRHVDEVWVATDFVRAAIEPHAPVPVRTVMPPLPQAGSPPTLTRSDLGLPDNPLLLFSFDFLSTAERKNPWGLVDAFRSAFAPGEGPVLVVKSINAHRRPDDAERLRLTARGRPDVLLLEQHLDADARDALVSLCDGYVSLHRSEGLGLTIAEAMARGKPVIATGYSGNLQFMTAENSFLVPWSPTAIPDDAAPYPAGTMWADPDLDAAARLMRLVIDDPTAAAQRGARAASDIATLHSAEAAGRRVVEALAATPPMRPGGLARGPGAARVTNSILRRQ